MEEQRQRTFGYARIVWEIDNCFCVAYRNNWRICSQEFSVNGFLPIKWRFVLRGTKTNDNNEYTAWLDLERLGTNGNIRSVRIFWNVSFILPTTPVKACERAGISDATGCTPSRIPDFKRVQERMQNISNDRLNIEAFFMVTTAEDSLPWETSNDTGLRNLSEQLCVIYNLKDYNDLKINMGRKFVNGHKAILSSGNIVLRNSILVSSTAEIRLLWSDIKSAEKVLEFLYTGNLGYILRFPSILLHRAIKQFGVLELEKYFKPDELVLYTRCEAREVFYKWEVPNRFSGDNGFIISPYFGARDLNITFRFRLEMKDIFATTGNVILYLEASGFPRRFTEIYIRFEIVHYLGISLNRKRSERWSIEEAGTLGLENFLTADMLTPLATADSDLRGLGIICRIFMPAHTETPLVLSNRTRLMPVLDYEEHFRLFSKRIESLFDTGRYTDLTVRCGEQPFYVHSCILSARSPVLAEGIKALKKKSFSIPYIDCRIMRIVFIYIYSGVLKNYEPSDVSEIYRAAAMLCMVILKNQCAKILEERLLLSNVLDTLFLASEFKERKLKFSAFRFIFYNINEIRKQDKFEKFVSDIPLYEEFKRYATAFVRNNPDERLRLVDI